MALCDLTLCFVFLRLPENGVGGELHQCRKVNIKGTILFGRVEKMVTKFSPTHLFCHFARFSRFFGHSDGQLQHFFCISFHLHKQISQHELSFLLLHIYLFRHSLTSCMASPSDNHLAQYSNPDISLFCTS